jgi:hypothetical protein
MDEMTNHPADRLARVKEQIKALEAEEKSLKAAVLDLPEEDRAGRWYEVSVREQTASRVDNKKLVEAFGEDWLQAYKTDSTSTVITVRALE